MDYKIVDYYLDCPYKAMLALSNKKHEYDIQTIFRQAAEKSIQHMFYDKINFTNKLKLNRAVTIFERELTANKISGETFELLNRRFINNMKLLQSSLTYDITASIPGLVLNIPVRELETVQMQLLGYHTGIDQATQRSLYQFYIYEPDIKNERVSAFLRVKLLVQALKAEPSINVDQLKSSALVLLDFYNNERKIVPFKQVSDITSLAHLESVIMGIKLGLSHPSPKPYHCDKCPFKSTCIYSCESKQLSLNAEQELIRHRYKQIIEKQY